MYRKRYRGREGENETERCREPRDKKTRIICLEKNRDHSRSWRPFKGKEILRGGHEEIEMGPEISSEKQCFKGKEIFTGRRSLRGTEIKI